MLDQIVRFGAKLSVFSASNMCSVKSGGWQEAPISVEAGSRVAQEFVASVGAGPLGRASLGDSLHEGYLYMRERGYWTKEQNKSKMT